MLFIPIEPAFMEAVKHDQELWHFAYDKKILLISPTNLIVALKMVNDLWKQEKQQQNAYKIAKRGQLLYDKFAGFVEDMDKIEKYIKGLSSTYSDAIGKLSEGEGNLIGQAKKLKSLGVNPRKRITRKIP